MQVDNYFCSVEILKTKCFSASAVIKVKWGGLPLEVMLTEEGAYEGLAMFYFFDPCAQVCSFCENLSCTLITCVLF